MPSHFIEDWAGTSSFRMTDDTGILLSGTNGKIDWIAQKTSSISKYELIEKSEVTKTEISNLILYWHGMAEFEMRLAQVGFKDFIHETGYGNHQSDIVTFIAFK